MNIERVIKAKQEALRFLEKVAEFEKVNPGKNTGWVYGSKESGSLKRSSMDLTRALADLRRPE